MINNAISRTVLILLILVKVFFPLIVRYLMSMRWRRRSSHTYFNLRTPPIHWKNEAMNLCTQETKNVKIGLCGGISNSICCWYLFRINKKKSFSFFVIFTSFAFSQSVIEPLLARYVNFLNTACTANLYSELAYSQLNLLRWRFYDILSGETALAKWNTITCSNNF